MRVKVKNIPFGYLAVKPGKIYDALESSHEYIINIDGRDYGIPRDYCEVYKPFAMAKEIKNPDGTYTYLNPVAVKLQKDLAWTEYDDFENRDYSPNTHKIGILQRGLVIVLGEAGGTSVVVSLFPKKFKFPIQVFWNNPDYFEPIYDEEKPLSDVKKINVELRIEKIKKELETLLGDIKKWE